MSPALAEAVRSINGAAGKMLLSIFLSISSATLLILCFPKPNLAFLAWVALIPWLFALRNKKPLEAFLLSYLTGLVFFSGVIYWVTYVTGLGFTLLVLYLASYFALFGLVFSIFNFQFSIFNLFILPCTWVALEYTRSHLFSGFGWALLGYSQYQVLPIVQISDIAGAYGVSFLLVLVNLAVYRVIIVTSNQKPETRKTILSTVYCLLSTIVLVLGYGYFRLNYSSQGGNIRVATIQGNIPQGMKWDPEAQEYILEKYTHLSEQAALAKPQLVVWPETSVPGYLESDTELLRRIKALSRKISPAALLVGTPQQLSLRAKEVSEVVRQAHHPSNYPERSRRTISKTYNSASLLVNGKITQRYDKLHLVPFGEFTPWPELFSRFSFAGLIGQFTPGENYTVFSLQQKPEVRFSALICFEDTFGNLARRFVRKGAQFLVNITNDAWFGDSSELEQHLQASVFRAVENRVNLVRSANTGVSCFINPWGKILSRTSGYLTQDLQIVPMASFYTRFGDIFAWLCLLVSGFTLFAKKGPGPFLWWRK